VRPRVDRNGARGLEHTSTGPAERTARAGPQWARVAAGVQEVRIDLALHDRPPAALRRRGKYPRRQRHPRRQIQRRRAGDEDETARAAEAQRIAVAPQRRPRRALERARVVVAGGVANGRARALVKTPRSDQA